MCTRRGQRRARLRESGTQRYDRLRELERVSDRLWGPEGKRLMDERERVSE